MMKPSLERLSVLLDDTRQPLFTMAELSTELGCMNALKTVRDVTGAPTDAVAASVFFRRLGFFFAAQFQSITVHSKMFAGHLSTIGVIQDDLTFKFTVPNDEFVKIENREQAMRFVLDTYGHPLIQSVSKQANISKLILWENIWGYVIWVYSQLIQDGVDSAEQDLDFLLIDETWKPRMRRSPFKQYLQNQTALDAMKDYKRITCCLLKEMPDTSKCPYCPLTK
jgi:ferric iron reductase protein FhuF